MLGFLVTTDKEGSGQMRAQCQHQRQASPDQASALKRSRRSTATLLASSKDAAPASQNQTGKRLHRSNTTLPSSKHTTTSLPATPTTHIQSPISATDLPLSSEPMV